MTTLPPYGSSPPRPDQAADRPHPKCPTCGSLNLERISAANKVKNAGLFGVFAIGAVSKQFHCLNCDYRW